jgi:hypothetical protein
MNSRQWDRASDCVFVFVSKSDEEEGEGEEGEEGESMA